MDTLIVPESDIFDQFFFDNGNQFAYQEDSDVEIFLPDEPVFECAAPHSKNEEESAPASTTHETTSVEAQEAFPESRSLQSKLHNCPKHLVKFLAQALDLAHLDRFNFEEVFGQVSSAGRAAIKGLLEILLQSHKGKIKSTSKELLKIIFETGAERNRKFKLLSNQRIRAFFQNHDPMSVSEAKANLREYTIVKLLLKKNSFIDESRIVRKDINERYVEIFIKELQEGLIKERISKSDKLTILEACKNF